jgi:hypothetical protein
LKSHVDDEVAENTENEFPFELRDSRKVTEGKFFFSKTKNFFCCFANFPPHSNPIQLLLIELETHTKNLKVTFFAFGARILSWPISQYPSSEQSGLHTMERNFAKETDPRDTFSK